MFGFFRMGPPRSPPFAEFEKLRELIFLYQIQVASPAGGITGYELKTLFSIPQTSVYRALSDLEEKNLIKPSEKIVEGRAQKRYMLTEDGETQLEEMKHAIAGKLLFLFEIITPEIAGKQGSARTMELMTTVFKNRVREASSREDALDLLANFRDFASRQLDVLGQAIERSKRAVEFLSSMMDTIESMDESEYSPDKILEFIDQDIERYNVFEE
ncbi:MAG TPA: PadR family transcriptional regulator [Candidatus Lokiarchaeia archaeon]|nr:PadR family transcriptional regulator [Candidatus Lokiarchaeia archaeon]